MTVMPNAEPENVPTYTYVATIPTFNDFLTRAKKFHKNWGLNPIDVSSLEDVLAHLAKKTKKGFRIRIVTHADDFIFLPLFKGGQKDQEITADLLNAFAKSDVSGLTLLFGNIVDLSIQLNGDTLLEIILADLRANAQNVLVPFGLKDAPSLPRGAVLELFQRGVEQVALQKAKPKTANIRAMQKALGIMLAAKIDGLRGRVSAEAHVTSTQVQRLEDAIIVVARNLTITFNTPSDTIYFLNLKAAVNAITSRKFRDILDKARKRPSSIDIRGCRAGADLDYLKAIANFFGSTPTKPITVTGPDFYQSFPTPASRKFNSGEAPTLVSSKPKLESELDHWAQVTGQATTISPAYKKLISYCDGFVLPVPEVNAQGNLNGVISMLVLGSAGPGSSGFFAITHWLDSQWLSPPGPVEAKKNTLRDAWANENKVPLMIGLSKNLHDPTAGQETFLVPDPRYMTHIKSTT